MQGLLMICHLWSFLDYSLFSIIRKRLTRQLFIHNDWSNSPDTCSPITRRVNAAFSRHLDSPSGVVHPSTLIWSVGYFKPSPSHPSDGGNSIWPVHGVCVVILLLERNYTIGRAGTKFIVTWRALNRSMIGERDTSRRSWHPALSGATSKARGYCSSL